MKNVAASASAAWRRWRIPLTAVILFAGLLHVYWNSVPARFNTVYENRRFFDSDGEFITRQFAQGKTFTHNDHLLYHVLGRLVFEHADRIPGLGRNPVSAHKALSVAAGAAACALLFVFGARLTGSFAAGLLGALLLGGSAGFWFFSATIDTYMPHLCAAVLALGIALRCLRTQRLADYVWLGAALGLAFLLRTDAFLLAPLLLVLCGARARFGARLAAVLAAGLLVGLGGYVLLAQRFYQVPLSAVPAWSVGVTHRPEAGQHWGKLANITGPHVAGALANQTVYTVILPGLTATRSAAIWTAMSRLPLGRPAFMLYAGLLTAALGWLLLFAARSALNRDGRALIPPLIAAFWFAARTAFYTWWDPRDPFLFAVLSLPAIWLVALHALQPRGLADAPASSQAAARPLTLLLLGIAVLAIWTHNYLYLIRPLRAL